MNPSLLFLPDISGFTEFVQTTEVEHSQHVISELLEVLIGANTQELILAEVEGDALFYYKEEIPSMEKLLAQVETMFTAFYSHLKLLEKNRICPCHACASAPNLQLKIIAHSGELQYITVQGKKKPFGTHVIEAHRLMKNSVESDNYLLISCDLADTISLPKKYKSQLFKFNKGANEYDGKKVKYIFSVIDNQNLKLKPFTQAKKIEFDRAPNLIFEKDFEIPANQLLEYITNYTYRHHWIEGVDRFEFNENEVTRIGTEHVCVINDKHLNFITVTKQGEPGQLVYGELLMDQAVADEIYSFYVITPMTPESCKVDLEIYWKAKSPIKKMMLLLFAKKIMRKTFQGNLNKLYGFVEKDISKLKEAV